ncbi:MAG: LacI family DNA-binding transcriptional regulator [Acidimicrobiales bacterium]
MSGRDLTSGRDSRPVHVQRATMRNVAALAGVGKTTVSRVFNSDPTVSPEIVSRVRTAAAQLNYQPNQAASDLRRRDGRPSTIGLLIQDVANMFWANIFRAVDDVAIGHNVSVLAGNIDGDPKREHQLVANLISRRVNGLIIVPASYDHSYLQYQQRVGTPVVFVDRPPLLLAADSVVSDCRVGAYTAIMHLAQSGHRHIAFLGESTQHAPAIQRYEGYVEALRDIGVALNPAIVRRDSDTEDASARACVGMLSGNDPPTAFFTAHLRATLGAIEALSSLGREETCALVGFDDFPLFDHLRPGVSVIAQDARALGKLAAEVLFERIAGDTSPVKQHVVPTRLIERGSGEVRAHRTVADRRSQSPSTRHRLSTVGRRAQREG